MDPTPFPHHGPLTPSQVHGRDELIAQLVEMVSEHRPAVLIAPRRFGKTSLLGTVAHEVGPNVTVVRVDLYELRSWADLTGRLADALTSIPVPVRQQVDRLAASVNINLGLLKGGLDRAGQEATAEQLLELLVRYAADNPTVVIFDELSSIDRIDGAAGLLRTRLQHHYQHIGLLFAGSEPSTMRMLFSDVDQPFYAQADLVEVPPLSLAAFTDIVTAGFDGRPPAGLAGQIHAFTGGHPQRSMLLADAAWRAHRDGSSEPWADALSIVRTSTASGHETRFAAATTADQAVLRLVANDQGLFSRGAALLDLSRSSAQRSRDRLLATGQITKRDEQFEIVDPLYADWITRRFPNRGLT